jgi:nucleoside diphosphate kinase
MQKNVEPREKYLLIIKPDGNKYFNEIFKILYENQVNILSIKCRKLSNEEVENVYKEHKSKYFFGGLLAYMTMDKCYILAVESSRESIHKAKSTIRELARINADQQVLPSLLEMLKSIQQIDTLKLNVGMFSEKFVCEYLKTFDGIHCSDVESASREVDIFFDEDELKCIDFNLEKSARIVLDKVKTSEAHQKSKNPAESEGQHFNFFNCSH